MDKPKKFYKEKFKQFQDSSHDNTPIYHGKRFETMDASNPFQRPITTGHRGKNSM